MNVIEQIARRGLSFFPRRICKRKGHDWFPSERAREFTPLIAFCLRCAARQPMAPWGECLRGHPMALHYVLNEDGVFETVPYKYCQGPL